MAMFLAVLVLVGVCWLALWLRHAELSNKRLRREGFYDELRREGK